MEFPSRWVLLTATGPDALPEDIAVGTSLHEGNGSVVFVPYKEPVVLDVAFPQRGHAAGELVRPVTWLQCFASDGSVYDFSQAVFVLASSGRSSEIPV